MKLKLVEPLRYLFKDEVREVGLALGLPDEMVNRQPFPGPGLAIRIIGEVTPEKLDTLQRCDWVVIDEIKGANLYHQVLAELRRTHRQQECGSDGRLPDLQPRGGHTGGQQRRRDDRGLGAPALRGAGAHLQQDRQ